MVNPDAIGNYRTFDLMRGLGRVGTGAMWPSMSDVRVYCGLGAVVLAVLGCRAGGEAKRLGAVLLVVPVIAAILTPLFLILYFRVLAASAAGIAVLAALGLQRLGNPDDGLRKDCRKVLIVLIAAILITLGVGTVVSVERARLQRRVEEVGTSQTSVYKADKAWQIQKARETVRNFTLSGHAVARFCGVAAIVSIALIVRRGTRNL